MRSKVVRGLLPIAVILIAAYGVWHFFLAQQVALHKYPVKCAALVEKYAVEYKLPREMIYAVILTESSFSPSAVSHANAKGLMQLTDDTNTWVALMLGEPIEDESIFDPELNIRRGSYLLAYLYREFGTWETALAAYNAGIGRVRGWLGDTAYSADGATLDAIPIEETREYVSRVLHSADRYSEIYSFKK